ncbi:MAG: hypothetical protein IGS48_04185 [Oscillatoriales cyanobacterium C42_A2020_001]|nr:hypothetical protein [Leptolyngbyaceae cyanobacterium C42_A2020_001]
MPRQPKVSRIRFNAAPNIQDDPPPKPFLYPTPHPPFPFPSLHFFVRNLEFRTRA